MSQRERGAMLHEFFECVLLFSLGVGLLSLSLSDVGPWQVIVLLLLFLLLLLLLTGVRGRRGGRGDLAQKKQQQQQQSDQVREVGESSRPRDNLVGSC